LNRTRIHALLVAAAAAVFAVAAAGSTNVAPAAAASAATAKPKGKLGAWVPPEKRIDINSASRKKLMTLPGVGKAEATRIIDGRPYLTKEHLVTKKVLSIGQFQAIRAAVIAVQKLPPKASSKKGKS
jgi:competence protein ComEA